MNYLCKRCWTQFETLREMDEHNCRKAKEETMSRKGTDEERTFVEDNFWWLANWFRSVAYHNRPTVTCEWEGAPATNRMQIFKIMVCPAHSAGDDIIRQHMSDILLAAVFGRGSEGEIVGRPYRYMSGFVELFGRRPEPEDKVGFWTLCASRWFFFKRVDEIDITKGIELMSEGCIAPAPAPSVSESEMVHSLGNLPYCPVVARLMSPGKIVNVNSVLISEDEETMGSVTCPHCKHA